MRTPVLTLLLALAAGTAAAQMTPAGLWKTIDDESKKEKSLVRIVDEGGVVSGRIEKLLDPEAKAGEVCDKCSDERKDKPIVGLSILRNLKQSGSDKTVWEGGEVLDPNNGKTYRARLQPVNGGKELQLRGYLGPFYRTQTWIRVE
ncbi:DUF2147 domain-containing protein [Pseudorhodoferax sp.]|uniref:DUF2147 domain-containing protein n=1 Tax=Pseudorhodoferax sp. TaxID=1993553 RepID=UPI002DD6A68E|nr:DUF2147 domain-containing protein [Pseudorhodoferax sp.]